MFFSYLAKLLWLSAGSFYVLNLIFGVLARLYSARALCIASRLPARAAARFLFSLRVLPSVVATVLLLTLVVPSYLFLEPNVTGERPGYLCIAFGLSGALVVLTALERTLRAIVISFRYSRACRKSGNNFHPPHVPFSITLVENQFPIVALTGLLRPHILISRSVLESLSVEQIEAILSHEAAHHGSRDNLKRLYLLLVPDSIPFCNHLSILDRHWAKFAEWAADDAASRADLHSRLVLAGSLVRIARLGIASPLPKLHTCLVSEVCDLPARVERLLRAEQFPPAFDAAGKGRLLHENLPVLITGLCAAVALWLAALPAVHDILERFFH
jgi:Zn-dependent protease with chaperone function